MRNPSWSQDELILTLDFYLRHAPRIPSKTSKEILNLSELLNRLRKRLGVKGNEKFRNVNGVYMKLMNLRRLDPNHAGVGLERGGKEEEVISKRYSSHPEELRTAADTIRSFASSDTVEND